MCGGARVSAERGAHINNGPSPLRPWFAVGSPQHHARYGVLVREAQSRSSLLNPRALVATAAVSKHRKNALTQKLGPQPKRMTAVKHKALTTWTRDHPLPPTHARGLTDLVPQVVVP